MDLKLSESLEKKDNGSNKMLFNRSLSFIKMKLSEWKNPGDKLKESSQEKLC
jgi:hypothetical protein